MPIDINWLRKEKGGDPDKWRQIMKMRFRPVEQIDKVIALDEVSTLLVLHSLCGEIVYNFN